MLADPIDQPRYLPRPFLHDTGLWMHQCFVKAAHVNLVFMSNAAVVLFGCCGELDVIVSLLACF